MIDWNNLKHHNNFNDFNNNESTTMFNAQAALAALLTQEFATPTNVALPGAQLALEAERKRLAEAQEKGEDPSTRITWC